MAYVITKSDGTTLIASLADYAQDNTTSITLMGRSVENYGQIVANTLVHMLENFSSTTAHPPNGPLVGQLWYKNDIGVLTYWDGSDFRALVTADGINNSHFVTDLLAVGDVTGTSAYVSNGHSTIALSLANTGTAGSYQKVSTDGKGRVISGGQLNNADISNALGYTPVQQGTGIGQLNNAVKIGWSDGTTHTANKVLVTIDQSDIGSIAFESWVTAGYQPKGNYQAAGNYQNALGFTPVQQGGGVSQLNNSVKIGWSAAGKVKVTVDATDEGNIAFEGWVSNNFKTQDFSNLIVADATPGIHKPFDIPAGVNKIYVQLVGGGGAGGSGTGGGWSGGGGGAGSYAQGFINVNPAGSRMYYTVGTGGLPTPSGQQGGFGTFSEIEGYVRVEGCGGGQSNSPSGQPTVAGSGGATGANNAGFYGTIVYGGYGSDGQGPQFVSSTGGYVIFGGDGAASFYGGGGRAGAGGGKGGQAFGAGGGGSYDISGSGGPGANGVVFVWY